MTGGRRAVWVAFGIALACATGLARGQPAPKAAAQAESEWARGNRVLLGVTQARIGFSAQWRFERAANGDILLEKEESRAGQLSAGSLILVGSGALAARGLNLERGRELDSINGPLLTLQLVLRLLERAAPSGPRSLSGDRHVDVTEAGRAIKVSGLGSDVEFLAPWRAKGRMGPGGPGQVKLELEFVSARASAGGQPHEINIAGIWQDVSPPVALPDSMSLRGWRVYQIKPAVQPRGALDILGLGASAPMVFANLGQVRRSVVEWADERARRARWQCS